MDQKSIGLIPDYVDAHNNLGNIYMQSGKPQFAAPCFRRAVELNPGFAAAYGNLGVALKDLKQFSEAIGCFRKAIEFEPEAVHHHQNLGNVYKNLKLYDEAVESYRKSLALNPLDAESYKKLIRIFYIMGEVEQSLEVVKQWLTYDPENPTALHTYAAYTKTDIPTRASDGYVRQTFDGFAATFDTVLQRLDYQAPLLVKNALQRLEPDPDTWRLLDAGCGTGLFGELVRPMVKHLAGVDLSPKMLERAATRAVYDQLLEAELTAYFQRSQSVFEAVSCVDTLCYFGDLNEVMQSAVNILKPGGWFVFTLEKQAESDTEPGFSLNLHGRYSHTETYVRQVLSDAGFEIETLKRKRCAWKEPRESRV